MRTSSREWGRCGLIGACLLAFIVALRPAQGQSDWIPGLSEPDASGRESHQRDADSALPFPRAAQPNREVAPLDLKDRIQVLKKGSSSKSSRKEAIDALPMHQLTPKNRGRITNVLDEMDLFRELPTLLFEIEPATYRYFADHPEAAVSIWQAMNISEFKMTNTGPEQYSADAGDGTVGTVEVLYRGGEHTIAICHGILTSPLLVKPVQADAVLHLETGFARDERGTLFARHRLKLFVSFPSNGVAVAAKLISPVSNRIIDRNFQEISLFLHMMSVAMSRQPSWVERLSTNMTDVSPETKQELLDVTTRVHLAAVKRAKWQSSRETERQ